MKLIEGDELRTRQDFFLVLATTGKSQTAIMTLQPGQVSGEYGNDHAHADQVLMVLSGEGVAVVEGQEVKLAEGDTVVIAAGENHQIKAGEKALKTLNVYAPVAYPEEA